MRGSAAQRPHTGAGTTGMQGRPWHGVVLVLAVVAVFAVIHQVILNRAHPDALYMDSLRLLFQLDQWQAGQLSTFEFWGGSSHRGFVNQLFLWANVSLFDLDVLLANRLTGAVISAVAACLCISWMADMRHQPGAKRPWLNVVVVVTVAALCFSWAGYELLTLDLGLPLWTKNLAFVAFFCGHAHLLSARSRCPAVWVVALVLAAPLIVLVCGMGWNYAFVGAVLVVQVFSFLPRWRAEGRWTGILPSAAVGLSMVVYLLSGSVTDASTRNGLNVDADLPVLLLYSVGSTMGYPEAVLMGGKLPLATIAVLGGILLLVGVIAAVAWLRRGAPGSRLPLLLALYGVLIAASLTLARGAEGPFAVMASRYYMDLVLGLVGVIWLVARELQAAPRGAQGWNVLVGGLLSAVLLTQLLTYVHEWKASPFREGIFASMNKALLRAVPDDESANLLQAQLDYARKGANVMRERHLALYADSTASDCSTRGIEYTQGWHAAEGAVRWSGAHASLALPPCGCAYFAELYVPPGQSERHVRISTAAGNEDVLTVQPGQAARARVGNEHAELAVSPVSIPSRDQPGSSDTRELGVLLTGFSVSCEVP